MVQKKRYQVLQACADAEIKKLEQKSEHNFTEVMSLIAVYHDALATVCCELGVSVQGVLTRAAEKRHLKEQLSDSLGSIGEQFDEWLKNKNIHTKTLQIKNDGLLISPNRIFQQIMFSIVNMKITEESIGFHRGSRAKRRIDKREISEQNRNNRLGKRNVTTSERREAAKTFLQSLIKSQGLEFVLSQSFSSLGQSLRKIYPSKINEADNRNYANAIQYALNQITN